MPDPRSPWLEGYEPDDFNERLLNVACDLRLILEDVARPALDEVEPTSRSYAREVANFDAGHLCAAETIILAALQGTDDGEEYPGLEAYQRWQANRRLLAAVIDTPLGPPHRVGD